MPNPEAGEHSEKRQHGIMLLPEVVT